MIDIDEYESVVYRVTVFLEDNEQYGDDWSEEKKELNDLLAEVKRLRGIIDYIRDIGRLAKQKKGLPSSFLSIMEKVLTTEEYLEWRNE